MKSPLILTVTSNPAQVAARTGQCDCTPGDPDDSILIYGMAATAPKVMMPQIGRALVHAEGLALLRDWVGSLTAQSCRL